MGRMSLPASPMSSDQLKTLDSLVQRVDEDRWLSSRYAPGPERRALMALYAFNYELVRVPSIASEPTIGAIRYQWWRDAVAEIAAGKRARRHDTACALGDAMAGGHLQAGDLERLIDGQEAAFEAADRSLQPEALLMSIAARILDPGHDMEPQIAELAPAYAAARRGEEVPTSGKWPRVPAAIRPALAHARLRMHYQSARDPGRLVRRITVLRAILTGRV